MRTGLDFIPPSELRRLRCGSYEQRIEEAMAALAEEYGDTGEVLATYSDSVLWRSAQGFRRVYLHRDGEQGQLEVSSEQSVEVEVIDEEALPAFAERAADEIAALFLKGARASALIRLEALALLDLPIRLDEGKVLETVIGVVEARRLWRDVVQTQHVKFAKFVTEDVLCPKFRKLYDRTIEESSAEAYSEIVDTALRSALERLTAMLYATRVAYENVSGRLSEVVAGADVLPVYQEFAQDLISDLEMMVQIGDHAAKKITAVGRRGKLCDVLSEGLNARQIASRFVVAVADRLIEAK